MYFQILCFVTITGYHRETLRGQAAERQQREMAWIDKLQPIAESARHIPAVCKAFAEESRCFYFQQHTTNTLSHAD